MSITVTDANDPPTMVAATTTLSGIDEGDVATIILNSQVSSLISDADTAPAFSALGIAVTGFTEADAGSWEYSTNGGSNWADLPTSLSETTAFLIDASDANGQIRFVSVPVMERLRRWSFTLGIRPPPLPEIWSI